MPVFPLTELQWAGFTYRGLYPLASHRAHDHGLLEGVVRQKSDWIYVKVDGLGETLLFTRFLSMSKRKDGHRAPKTLGSLSKGRDVIV